jgi:hypothetical protein
MRGPVPILRASDGAGRAVRESVTCFERGWRSARAPNFLEICRIRWPFFRHPSHEAGRHFLANFCQSCREDGQNRGCRREVRMQKILVAQGFSSSSFSGSPPGPPFPSWTSRVRSSSPAPTILPVKSTLYRRSGHCASQPLRQCFCRKRTPPRERLTVLLSPSEHKKSQNDCDIVQGVGAVTFSRFRPHPRNMSST